MNPPFSAMANVAGRMADAALRHIASALARLADGGRLVAITGANFGPDTPAWRDAFVRLQERGRIVFTAAIDGAVYAKHGTTIDTRLIVIDKAPADEPGGAAGIAGHGARRRDLAGLDRASMFRPRLPLAHGLAIPMSAAAAPRTVRGYLARAAMARPFQAVRRRPGGGRSRL